MVFKALALLLVAPFCSHVIAVNVEVENSVYKLDETTFDSVLNKFPVVMVNFYDSSSDSGKELLQVCEKAAKSLRKAAESSGFASGGARIAKVDVTAQAGLAAKYAGYRAGYPSLVVFKAGAPYGLYRGGRDKDDLVGYLQALLQPPPLDWVLEGYWRARGFWKAFLRLFLPGRVRKYLIKGFPAVLASPLLLLLFCRLCCRGGAKPLVSKSEHKAKRPARSESSARDATNGKEENASDAKTDEGAEKEEEKTEGEKKEE